MDYQLSQHEKDILLYVSHGGRIGGCPSPKELISKRQIARWQRLAELGLLKLRDDNPEMYVLTDKGRECLE